MGRAASRSRGCQPCRQRKIKCDEKKPECSYCLRRGIKCPGAIIGTIFIDISSGKRKLIASTSNDLASVGDSQVQPEQRDRETAGIISKLDLEKKERDYSSDADKIANLNPKAKSMIRRLPPTGTVAQIHQQCKLPTAYQPSRASMFDNLFIMHFIDFYWDKKSSLRWNSWIQFLPGIFATCPSPAIRYSIRAATTAVYGHLTKNESIQSNALRWYTLGLEEQRMSIQKMKMEGTGTPANGSIVFVALLFVRFELAMSTQPDAWVPHAIAAEQHLLDLMSAQKCRKSLLHYMFLDLRRSSYQVSVILKRPSPFAADEWCLNPCKYVAQDAFDSLLTIILHVPSCQFLYTQLSASSTALENENAKRAKEVIIANCMKIMLKLDEYWMAHNGRFNEELIHDHTSCENPCNTSGVRFSSPEDCKQELCAYYASARIILNSLLALTSPNRETQQIYEEQVLQYSARVLSKISSSSDRLAAMTGRCLMGFPLRVIYEYSRCSVQRQKALDARVRWETGRNEAREQKSVIPAAGLGFFWDGISL